MKIERINENQIRCTLTSLDLSSRGINLMELAYGTEKARRLFREMIQCAYQEVGFIAEDIPLMVEAIPMSDESITLVITKIEDPDELDTRFAKFTPFTEEDPKTHLARLAREFLEGAHEALSESQENGSVSSPSAESVSQTGPRIFLFDSLDKISEAARAVRTICPASSTLYKKPNTRQYYLVLNRDDGSELDFSRTCNILAEYSVKLPAESVSEAYFKEHYQTIIAKQALNRLMQL